MNRFLLTGVLLVLAAEPALAQRPVVYPLRSQDTAAQAVDNAYCYWQARKDTNVDMARESQRPQRTQPIGFAADAGRGMNEPPLPARAGHGQAASSASGVPATKSGAGKGGATARPPAQASASGAPASGPTETAGESARLPAAPDRPSSAAFGTAASATSRSASQPESDAKLPPLPPPEPPMTLYWRAYGDCMQSRGYGVQ